MLNTVAFLLCVSVPLCCTAVDVTTQYGPVRGRTTEVNNGRTISFVDEFRGIPFAADTSGTRRFSNPEPPEPWTDTFEAFTAKEACPQNPSLIQTTNPTWDKISEDCLHLDIYTPDAASDPDSYHVMVWMYGGAFQQGANVQYPGHFLATHGVIVVVVNYRVGKFGFAYTGNDACPGNAGLWDQRMALEFVVNNIRNFGGDPTRITVFGESAGAGSTALLMLSPQSKDLFQQAILESGSETNEWVTNDPDSQPDDYIRQVAQDLDCPVVDDYEMIDCLREQPMDNIIYNSSIRCTPGYLCLGMLPTVDGPSGFLPKTPAELRADGDVMSGPVLSGIMQDDASIFVPIFVPGTIVGCCNQSHFERVLRERLIGIYAEQLDQQTEDDIFEAMDWNYKQWPYIDANENNRDALVRITTDYLFGEPWDLQMKQQQELADTFGFVFDYKSRNSTSAEWLGTHHGSEIPYVWGYPMLEFNEHIMNDSQLSVGPYNDEDIQYSIFFQELLTNFAKYSDPTFVDVQTPFGGSTVWPPFTTDTYQVLYFGNDVVDPISGYRQKQYAFWREYMGYIAHDIVPDDGVIGYDIGTEGLPSEAVATLMNNYLDKLPEDLQEEMQLLLEDYFNRYDME